MIQTTTGRNQWETLEQTALWAKWQADEARNHHIVSSPTSEFGEDGEKLTEKHPSLHMHKPTPKPRVKS